MLYRSLQYSMKVRELFCSLQKKKKKRSENTCINIYLGNVHSAEQIHFSESFGFSVCLYQAMQQPSPTTTACRCGKQFINILSRMFIICWVRVFFHIPHSGIKTKFVCFYWIWHTAIPIKIEALEALLTYPDWTKGFLKQLTLFQVTVIWVMIWVGGTQSSQQKWSFVVINSPVMQKIKKNNVCILPQISVETWEMKPSIFMHIS